MTAPRSGSHRDEDVAEGGDDAGEEAHDQGAVRGDHELCGRSHGDASGQGGVLDVHLSGEAPRYAAYYPDKNKNDVEVLFYPLTIIKSFQILSYS